MNFIIIYWTFKMLQKLHHTPYYMIMDSTYLLTCLVEIFYLECNMMPLIQRMTILKDFDIEIYDEIFKKS